MNSNFRVYSLIAVQLPISFLSWSCTLNVGISKNLSYDIYFAYWAI